MAGNFAFSDDVAKLAYFVHLAWSHGRAAGILSGKPAYEARELLASRVRGAVQRAADVREWGVQLFGRRGVGAKLEKLRLDDAMWWRNVSADPDGLLWEALHSAVSLNEILTACTLLPDWLYASLPTDTAADIDGDPDDGVLLPTLT